MKFKGTSRRYKFLNEKFSLLSKCWTIVARRSNQVKLLDRAIPKSEEFPLEGETIFADTATDERKKEELTVASQFHIWIVGIYGVHRGGCSGAVMVVRVHVQRVYENRESYNYESREGGERELTLPHPLPVHGFYIQEARLGKKSR